MASMESAQMSPATLSPEGDLLKEANHRIANHLSLIVGMVHAQASGVARGPATLTRDQVRELLQETAGKIVSVSHLHRHLAAQPHTKPLDLGNYLLENVTSLISSLGLASRARVVHRLDNDCSATPDQAQAIGLILSEVVMNAIKHAHPTGIATQVTIGCRKLENGAVTIEIGDDGVGLPENFDWKKGGGTGFMLIRSLAQKLGAELYVETDTLGTIFMLTMPATP
ncbi:MAG: sensor histidine kinase [Rhizomicrobium sp.]|jgi:two-component sensor histidine kinase